MDAIDIKQLILSTDSLTIRTEDTELLSELPDPHVKDALKQINWKGFYRLHFTIPGEFEFEKSPNEFPDIPIGRITGADCFLKDIKPKWTGRIEKVWLDSKFKQLDKALDDVWASMGKYIKDGKISWRAPGNFKQLVKSSAYTYSTRIKILECQDRRFIEGKFHMLCHETEEYLHFLGMQRSCPVFGIELFGWVVPVQIDRALTDKQERVYLFIEPKLHGLKNYIDQDGFKDISEVDGIVKEALKKMLATKTDTCIISDIETSILMQLDFTHEDLKNDEVPLKYHIFHIDDRVHTFQGILASMAYDQRLRVDDTDQEDNVKRLEEILITKEKVLDPPPLSEKSWLPFPPPITTYNWKENEYHQVSMELDDDYEILQMDDDHLKSVFKLNRSTIDKYFSHLEIPSSVTEVVMKVYDIFRSDLYFDNNEHDDLRDEENIPKYMGEMFNTEVESYRRIQKNLDILSPKMYGFGSAYIWQDSQPLSVGWYLILQYLEKDIDQRFDLDEAFHQIDLLHSLGIYHNNISKDHVMMSKGKFRIFDFCHATFEEVLHGLDRRNLYMHWEWQERNV